jgi:hypothetical protein
LAFASPSDGTAERGVEWSVAPATADEPDGRISLRHTIHPGGAVEDAIAVTNLSESSATFTVVTGAGMIGEDGAFDIGGRAESAGMWVSVDGLDGDKVTLEPGEVRVLPVVIEVPAEAAPGDHPAGIAVGLSQGAGVTVTHRIGVRVHLRVGGEIRPELTVKVNRASFEGSWIPFGAGRATIDYEVVNTGNVRLGATTVAQAAGPFGWGASSSPVGDAATELLPGDAVSRTVSIEAPALIRLGGSVAVTPKVVGADDVQPPQAIRAAFSIFAIPWTGIMLTVCLVAAALAIRRRRRNRRARA